MARHHLYISKGYKKNHGFVAKRSYNIFIFIFTRDIQNIYLVVADLTWVSSDLDIEELKLLRRYIIWYVIVRVQFVYNPLGSSSIINVDLCTCFLLLAAMNLYQEQSMEHSSTCCNFLEQHYPFPFPCLLATDSVCFAP